MRRQPDREGLQLIARLAACCMLTACWADTAVAPRAAPPERASPAIDAGTLGSYAVTELARVRPSQYWLDEIAAPIQPERTVEIVVPVIADHADRVRIVVGDTNTRVAIWISKRDVLARWKRTASDVMDEAPAIAPGGSGDPVPAGACLVAGLGGQVVGVVIADVLGKWAGQGGQAIAVYAPLGNIDVMALAKFDWKTGDRVSGWTMCR